MSAKTFRIDDLSTFQRRDAVRMEFAVLGCGNVGEKYDYARSFAESFAKDHGMTVLKVLDVDSEYVAKCIMNDPIEILTH